MGDIFKRGNFDYVKTTNPTIDVNPGFVGATWLNLATGEVFVCVDQAAGANAWRGQLGTMIPAAYWLTPEVVAAAMADDILYGPGNYSGTTIDTGVKIDATRITLVAKVKSTNMAAQEAIWSNYGSGSTDQHFGVRLNTTGTLYCFVDDGSSYSAKNISDVPLTVNVESDVIVEFDIPLGSTQAWVDGVYAGRTEGLKTSCNMTYNMKIGYDSTLGNFPGTISDAYFINAPVSESGLVLPY